VTENIGYGPVRLASGKTKIQAETTELNGGTSVDLGAELEINPLTP
jgi:hypothetical protein